jgi:AcrR family transcriptional regulator
MESFVDLSGKEILNTNKLKLLSIAIDAFSLRGFSSVSIRDITREAGIKESSFYNHFQSKEELQETIFFNFRMSIKRIMPPREELDEIIKYMDPLDFLLQGYRNYLDHIRSPKMEEIWRILYLEQCRNLIAREIYLNDCIHRTVKFMEAAFSKYIECQRIRPLSPSTLAAEYQYPLFAMISEFILLRLDGKATAEIEQKMMEHIRFFATLIVIAEVKA